MTDRDNQIACRAERRDRKSPEPVKADNKVIGWMVVGWAVVGILAFIVLRVI